MIDMTKIRLFYFCAMALILPKLKDIAHFVYTPLVKVNQAKFLIFWVSNERYDNNKTFLLRCYGIDFSLIKRFRQICIHTSCKSESSQIFTFFLSYCNTLYKLQNKIGDIF